MKKQDLSQPTFITVPRAAKICGVSRNTMFQWVRHGKLKAYQTPGKTNLIRPSDLVAFMRESGMFVPPDLATLAQEDLKLEERYRAAAPSGDFAALVVDDDASVREILVYALREICPVLQAQTGYEALHLLTLNSTIRLVLLDLRMPGQHGLQTLREIQTFRPDVRIMIVTGYDDEVPPEVRNAVPPVPVILKPFDVDVLREQVRSIRDGLAPHQKA
jgi:excisionase family DNA binding protein